MVVDALKLLAAHLRANLMSQLEYRSAVVMQAVGTILEDVLLLFFWYLFFSRLPTLNGWALGDVAVLYAVITSGFGLGTLICGNSFRVASLIAQGELDYYLVMPTPPLLHLLVSRSSLSAWGDITFGLLIFLMGGSRDLASLGFYVVSVVASALILVSFAAIAGSLAFFVGQAETLAMQGLSALMGFGMYPIDIFPIVVKVLLLTLLPAGLLGSLPAQAIRGLDFQMLLLVMGIAAAFALAAQLIFRLGLRRYESGNRIMPRM